MITVTMICGEAVLPEQHYEITGQDLGLPLLEAGGYHTFETAIQSNRRTTSCFHVTYLVQRNTAWVFDNGSVLSLPPDHIGIIQPNQEHWGEFGHDRPNAHFWFYFDPEHSDADRNTPLDRNDLQIAAQLLRQAGNTTMRADEDFTLICQQLGRELQAAPYDRGRLLSLRLLFTQVFVQLIRMLQLGTPHTTSEGMGRILSMIEQQAGRWSSVSALADELGLAADVFHAIFKEQTGLSPWNAILQARCRIACERLRRSEVSVTDLAFELGFSSSQHFAKVFRQHIGYTPRDFRRQWQAQLS